MNLERVFFDRRNRPHPIYKIALGDKLAARLNQNLQNLECAVPDRNGNTSGPQLTLGKIDLPPVRLIDGS
ncbi:hypothetical protein CDS [Bradyrhizobium sp.]|nr:hypothetical protein CDS [Bradyrhizobium sp.]